MTIWCRVCQKLPATKKAGDCAGLCDPCRQAVQVRIRTGAAGVKYLAECEALALARTLEAHRILRSWRANRT